MTVEFSVLSASHSLVTSFLDTMEKTEDYTDYHWEGIRDSKILENGQILTCVIDSEIQGFCFVTEPPEELSFIKQRVFYSPILFLTYKYKEEMATFLNWVTNHYPLLFVNVDGYYDELTNAGFSPINLTFEKGEYILPCRGMKVFGLREESILSDLDDKHKKGEVIDFVTEVKDKETLFSEIYNKHNEAIIGLYRKHNNSIAFLGFHYFTPEDIHLSYTEATYLTAHAIERKKGITHKKLVGILKLTKYNQCGGYYCISYIDVHYDYRRMGVAKKLYEQLQCFLTSSDVLLTTDLSPLGREANIDLVRKSIVTVCPMFDSLTDLVKWKQQQKV